jgi:hypothetical protein
MNTLLTRTIVAGDYITFRQSGSTYYVNSVDADVIRLVDVWADENSWHADSLTGVVRFAYGHEIDAHENEFERTMNILAYDGDI